MQQIPNFFADVSIFGQSAFEVVKWSYFEILTVNLQMLTDHLLENDEWATALGNRCNFNRSKKHVLAQGRGQHEELPSVVCK